MTYLKIAFDAHNLEHAKAVVLTPNKDFPNKFEEETKYLIDAIINKNIINSDTRVVDFGCGMGRISRELIRTFGCSVTGIDISDNMRRFAQEYVNSNKFQVYETLELENCVDICLCVFVLQHVENPQLEIERIHRSLVPGGHLILLNENIRYVPIDIIEHEGTKYAKWVNDKFNIFSAVDNLFERVSIVQYIDCMKSINFYRKP